MRFSILSLKLRQKQQSNKRLGLGSIPIIVLLIEGTREILGPNLEVRCETVSLTAKSREFILDVFVLR